MAPVILKGGLFVHDAALTCALALESRGHVLTANDGQLFVSNAAQLTADDRVQIRLHRLQLLGGAAYQVPE